MWTIAGVVCQVRKDKRVNREVENERMCSRAYDSSSSLIQKIFFKYLQNVRYCDRHWGFKDNLLLRNGYNPVRDTQLKAKMAEKIRSYVEL